MTNRSDVRSVPQGAPAARVRVLRGQPVRPDGGYVLYWMTAARRLEWNHALDHAVGYARALGRPLVVFEPLRAGYRWAADRHHAFVLQGMAEHAGRLGGTPVAYYPYVEPEPGAGRGLLAALAARACLVVADDAPVFFLPEMLAAAAARIDARLETVDSCGLLPLSLVRQPFVSAHHFRRFLQRELAEHLGDLPSAEPLREGIPGTEASLEALVTSDVVTRWPPAGPDLLAAEPAALARLPIDHAVPPSPLRGGRRTGRDMLERFLEGGLARYGEERNQPDADASSGLSPWLHFGHLSVYEIFREVAAREGWSPARLGTDRSGKRHGWWGMSASAESFLDELVTWRELGFGFCRVVEGYDRFESLPDWARDTLAAHAADPRPWRYDRAAFEAAETHDPVWNAAQRQLRAEGVIHNYLRMLWGKKILEWSASPAEALDTMVDLNNRWALDGRDPNSYTGIMWVLGRFDRGWPERAVYGKVRSMSSEATQRKVDLDRYLARWARSGRTGG